MLNRAIERCQQKSDMVLAQPFRRADLHVHSIYSEKPTHPLIKQLDARESYTAAEVVYKTAKARGMDFVTLTDHNEIAGSIMLQEKYPDDVITGIEVTSFFPEDECCIHILVYGLNEKQFAEIRTLRKNIYELRDFLKESRLAHSVAHACYSVNGKLTLEHLEKLILLFDTFEVINGGRSRRDNSAWFNTLQSLSPAVIESLYRKYHIQPFSPTAWIKGYTGGSDDHAGLFIGQTSTSVSARTTGEFLQALKNKESRAMGRYNDYQSLAFTFLKIAYDYAAEKDPRKTSAMISGMAERVIPKQSLRIDERIRLYALKEIARYRPEKAAGFYWSIFQQQIEKARDSRVNNLDVLYNQLSRLTDQTIREAAGAFTQNLGQGDVLDLNSRLHSLIGAAMILTPFLTTFWHMESGRNLTWQLLNKYDPARIQSRRKVLWFMDIDGNFSAQAERMRHMRDLFLAEDVQLAFAVCLPERDFTADSELLILNLPSAGEKPLRLDPSLSFSIPSLMKSLKVISDYEPDEIIISTPGLLGLLGLLFARLIQIRSVGFYDSIFIERILKRLGEGFMGKCFQGFAKWFYMSADKMAINTPEYKHVLRALGYNRMKVHTEDGLNDAYLFYKLDSGKYFMTCDIDADSPQPVWAAK